ncbi:MAG: MGMT family protein [bacterium]|nr:MGMT family protein [bacterium]
MKEKVYRIVMSIPFGNTITYKEIGIKVGALNPRVVGKILSKNDKLIAIPCHRVICSNGKTGGYRAGEDFKKHLIDWEKSIIGS